MTRVSVQSAIFALSIIILATSAAAIIIIPIQDLEPFGSPCDLSVTQVGGTRALSWSAVSGANSYKVGRITCAGTIEGLAETSDTSYGDTSWSEDECYEYVMVAYDADGQKICSAHVEGVGRCPCP